MVKDHICPRFMAPYPSHAAVAAVVNIAAIAAFAAVTAAVDLAIAADTDADATTPVGSHPRPLNVLIPSLILMSDDTS